MGRTDEVLLKASGRDPDAFRELYDRLADDVHAYFMRRLDDPQQAYDLTAETFAALYTTRRKYKPQLGNVRQWVFGIASNELARHFRKNGVERRAIDRLGVRLPTQPADHTFDELVSRLDADEASPALQAALERLEPDDRLAIEMRVLEQRAYEDIASRLGCDESHARVRVHRALKKVSRHLQPALGEPIREAPARTAPARGAAGAIVFTEAGEPS